MFQQEAESVEAVRDVSLTIERGEFTALAGPSGSGKTTLLNLIGGLTRPTKGRVWVAGHEVSRMSTRDLARLRLKEVGFVFQAYNLLPVLTALENAEFPMLLQGVHTEKRQARVRDSLHGREWKGSRTGARASCPAASSSASPSCVRWPAGPALVLADEPTANLDSVTSEALLDVMGELNRDLGVTFVFATHDSRVMERSRRLVRMVDGAVRDDEPRS